MDLICQPQASRILIDKLIDKANVVQVTRKNSLPNPLRRFIENQYFSMREKRMTEFALEN